MAVPPALRRVLYRAAVPLLRVGWFLLRPEVTGAKFVLTDGDRVLLVRHTYGPERWDVPGGWVRRREPPLSAARREAAEEMGVSIAQWQPLGVVRGRAEYRKDVLHCFAAALDGQRLTPDPGEIAEVAWFPRDALPDGVGRYVREIVELLPGR